MATVKKVYPIKGRKDFFKYVIIEKGKKAKDFAGKEMYFDNKANADDVKNAINRVNAKLKKRTTKRSKK